MNVIGLIGGISWVSTADYYSQINEGVNKKLGDLNFAECMIYSFNYQDIKNNNDKNDWDKTFEMLSKAAKSLEQSGAKAIIICANTMHFIADRVAREISIPLIQITTATAVAIQNSGIKRVGLLGTKFTMEYDFFKNKLIERGIEVLIPSNEKDRQFIHDTIFEELGRGLIKESTKQRYLSIIEELKNEGAQGIIAGCTEIPLLIQQDDIDLLYFDTTKIHVQAAIDFIVANG